jgi:hypothetical protein
MNERIKQLEEQCWEDVPVDIDYDYLSRVRRVFNREKFAELIVKECMTICEDVTERNDPAIACYYEIKRTLWS